MIGEGGRNFENWVENQLVGRFHEPFVHVQSRMMIEDPIRHKNWTQVSQNVDFLVYHKNGKFAVDTYYPSSQKNNFISNTRAKVASYPNIDMKIFLVIGNHEVPDDLVRRAVTMAFKTTTNRLISIYKIYDFLHCLEGYEPIEIDWKENA